MPFARDTNMKSNGYLCRLLSRFAVLLLGALAPLMSAADESGTIIGRVYNPTTSEYVRNAEVRVQGTNIATITASDGSFSLNNVPVGPATITVNFTGYDTATSNVTVAAGAPVRADVNITSPLYANEDKGIVKMEAFKVATEREGNAKAIMDQKQAMKMSNVVSAENFGNTAEGNVGEFLKYLPGIEMDYVEADARNPRIRGLPAQFTTVTFGGMDLASADGFIQNNGTDNGGGAGAGGRSFGFEQVSMSSVDSVEVNFSTDASQSAGAAAGSIDLRPKHAYQRTGQRIAVDVSGMANGEELFWHKVVKPDDRARRLILPNASFEYANSFLDHKLGVIVSVQESNIFNEQRQYAPTYDEKPTPADPRPIVLTRIQYKDGPKLTERSTFSFTVDYKVSPNLSVSLIGTLNNYGMLTSNRSFGVSTNRANVGGDGWDQWVDTPITGMTNSWAYLRKRTHGYTYLPMVEYKTHSWDITGSAAVSQSTNNYAGGQSGPLPGNNIGGVSIPSAQLTTIRVNAVRPDGGDLYAWQVVQTAGPSWSDLSNFKAGTTAYPTFGIDGRYNRVLKYQARADARYILPISIPTWIKGGVNVAETTYIFRNPTNWQSWNYVGPGGGLGGSWALYPSEAVFSQGHNGFFISDTGGTPAIANHNVIGELFATHPEYFQHNESVANYYTGIISTAKYIREEIDAGYGMIDSKPFRQLELQGGLRWERTRDATKDFDAYTSAEIRAAGYTPNPPPPPTGSPNPPGFVTGLPTGLANTIPGLAYQFQSRPLVERERDYAKIFPSAGLKYFITPNTQFLASYSYTITRPAYGDLAGTFTENDTALEINAPNPNLKPQYSNNYSLRLSQYFDKTVGALSVSVFENDVKSFIQTNRLLGAAADFGYDDPQYSTWTVVTKTNSGGKLVYRGATAEYSQNLTFLPKPFNGIGVFANYTRLYTQLKVSDPSALTAPGNPFNNGWVAGITPHKIAAGFTFKWRRFNSRVNAIWNADSTTTSTQNTYLQQNIKYDVSASYALTNRITAYFTSRNITNVPDITYISPNRQRFGGGRTYEYYGAYLYAGIRATF
jgi:iron complex outermembrane recepter protein